MKTLDFSPYTPEQFQLMAMRKARGHTWDDIAAQLQVPVETIERVAWTHEKLWDRTLAKAEKIVAREAITEVVNTLRKDLRYAEVDVRPTIANSLTRAVQQQQEYAPKKRPRPSFGPVIPVPPVASPPAPVVPVVIPEPEPPKAFEPPPAKSPEVPPSKPKLTIEQLLEIQKRVNAGAAAALCAFLGFVCLFCFTLLWATPMTNPLAAPLVETVSGVIKETVVSASAGVRGATPPLASFAAPSPVPKYAESA